jgi:uncharacterized membrane protein
MKRSTALAISIAIIGVSILYSAVLYPSLPNPAPSHWDANGKVNGYSDPLFMCLLMPAIMVGLLLLFAALPKLSPGKFKVDSWIRVYNVIMVLVIGLEGALHFVILSATRSSAVMSPRFLFCVLFLFFALIGNFLGKVRRNFWVGVRTPWTLANETVWNIVHRRAGQLWVVTGILGAILSILGMPFWWSFGLLMVSAFIPVFHSYFVWRRVEEGSGQLPTA